MKKTLLAVASFALLVMACSGSTETNGESTPTGTGAGAGAAPANDDVEAYCKATNERYATCANPAEYATDLERCRASEGACALQFLRPEAVKPLETCLASITCTKGASGCECERIEDACYLEVAKSLAATPATDAYERACRGKLAECGTKFSDDLCANVTLAKDAFYDAIRPCFDLACDAVQGCYRDKSKMAGSCK